MEPPSLDEALQYCLDNPDNLSDTQLLDRFPHHREELEPLLALDRQLKSALPRTMPAQSKALVRQRLMDTIAARQAAGRPAVTTAGKPTAGRTRPTTAPWWRSWLISGATAAVALVLLWWSAATSLPGNPLYPVKLGTENLLLSFSGSAPALIRGHLNLSDVRLVDIRTMQQRDALSQAEPAVDNYYYHIRNCLTLWEARQDDKDLDLARLLYASSVAGQRVLVVFGEGTVQNLPDQLRSEVRDSLTTADSLQSGSAGVLRGAGIDLDRVLQESKGTVAGLLAPIPGTGTPSPTVPTTATPGTPVPTGGAAQATPTPGIPAVPTLTAVLYAAQTTIAGAGSANSEGVAAAETVIAGGAGTPLSTPILRAIQTVLAQPTFVVSVEPRVTGTPLPGVTLPLTPQQVLTPLPSTIEPTTLLTPSVKAVVPTLTLPLLTAPASVLVPTTSVVPLPGGAKLSTVTPGAVAPTQVKVPTPQLSLPPLPPRLPKP